ncbi:MAG: amidase family protein [Candidatus Methanomethylophilaceae archaeon]|jgi:aspartyl-tRNA(Asn)/glutamyl-tRNA(Gln) amidotransferase subunit A
MSSPDVSKIKELNEKYEMFRVLNSNVIKGDFLFSVSDSFVTSEADTLCGSEILEGYNPPFDADSVIAFKEAGGVPIGKTNMSEFGTVPYTNGPYGIPKNPYDADRTCGGPSAGAACAASLLDTVSLSLSTCGSVLNSAAYCGVYGMVPTYGKVSKAGTVDAGSSVDRVGVISSKSDDIVKYAKILMDSGDGKKSQIKTVGIPKGVTDNVSDDVKKNFERNLEILKSLGFEPKTIELPSMKYAAIACRILTTAEASTSMSRYCGMRYGKQDGDYTLESDEFFTSVRTEHFGTPAKETILLGSYMRMDGTRERYYNKARMVRELMIEEYRSAFKECDVILTPTTESVAPLISETSEMTMVESFSADIFTAPPDLAGMPVLSVPCGYDNGGMPMGMMLIANHNEENKLFDFCETWNKQFDIVKPEAVL